MKPLSKKWRTILLLSLAELLAMSLWFSATAVVPALMEHWDVSGGAAAWLTMSVQIGFVAGALLSALLNLPDIFPPRKVLAAGALIGALLNALVPALDLGFDLLAASASDLRRCCLSDSVEQVRETLLDLTEIATRVRMGHRGSV